MTGKRPSIELILDRQIHSFSRYTEPELLRAEAENNMILGICSNLKSGLSASSAPPVLARFRDQPGCAIQSPPNPLIMTRLETEQIRLLARTLSSRMHRLSGVAAPGAAADEFAGYWCELTGNRITHSYSQGIYQLEQVILPPPVPGRLRAATHDDIPLLVEWMESFADEAIPSDRSTRAETVRKVTRIVGQKGLFVWEQDAGRPPVAMTGAWGRTPNGVRISAVYTPPALRGKGIASRLVAELSQQLLQAGRKFCFLYTDLANPTSNSIYRKIGYERVCDSRLHHFSEAVREAPSRAPHR